MSIPAPWAPPDLKALYEEQRKEGLDPKPLLIRFVSDSRMKAVWCATTVRRTPKTPEFPMLVYVSLSVGLSYPAPKKHLSDYKQQYRKITELARDLGAAMRDSLLFHEFIVLVNEIEKKAEEIESSVDSSFFPYRIERFPKLYLTKDAKKTLATKIIYRIFMQEFGTHLWESVAALVEVALDLPKNTFNYQKARNIILGTSSKLIKGHCP